MLSDIVNELKEVLEHQPVTKDKEQKESHPGKEETGPELEQHRDKLMEYDNHLDTLENATPIPRPILKPPSCA